MTRIFSSPLFLFAHLRLKASIAYASFDARSTMRCCDDANNPASRICRNAVTATECCLRTEDAKYIVDPLETLSRGLQHARCLNNQTTLKLQQQISSNHQLPLGIE